ncbi:uncharacterized protein LOC106993192 isoform X1 [Macaca mulatta]|uniref:Uncharacterized protein n=2 Tax=Macaca mulatta TaxID=9544 RepID=A0A5F7ZM56_MACMU
MWVVDQGRGQGTVSVEKGGLLRFPPLGGRERRGKQPRRTRGLHKARGQGAPSEAAVHGRSPMERGCKGVPLLREKTWEPWNELMVIGKRVELLSRNTQKPKLESEYWRLEDVEKTVLKGKSGPSQERTDVKLLHHGASASHASVDLGKDSPREIWGKQKVKHEIRAKSKSAGMTAGPMKGSGFEERLRSAGEKVGTTGEDLRSSGYKLGQNEELRSSVDKMRSSVEKLRSSSEKLVSGGETQGSSGVKLRTSGRKLRSSGENLRSSGENLRSSREKLRWSGEKLGTSDEKLKLSGEMLRSNGEKRGTSGEKLRSSREKLRLSGEKLGTSDEKLRLSGKKLRSSREKLGTSEEKLRSSREKLRLSGEKLRSSREKLGTSEEKLRSSREKLRLSGEKLGTSDEKLRLSGEKLRSSEEKLGTSEEKLRSSREKLRLSGEKLGSSAEKLRSSEEKLGTSGEKLEVSRMGSINEENIEKVVEVTGDERVMAFTDDEMEIPFESVKGSEELQGTEKGVGVDGGVLREVKDITDESVSMENKDIIGEGTSE